MKVLEPNPLFIKSRGDTPIGLMEIVRRGAQGVYGVSRSPPHFCNEATFGEKIAKKCHFSLHFEARFSKEYSFAKPLKNDAVVASVISRFGAAFRIRREDLLITNRPRP